MDKHSALTAALEQMWATTLSLANGLRCANIHIDQETLDTRRKAANWQKLAGGHSGLLLCAAHPPNAALRAVRPLWPTVQP
jgi:hypothetical protein